MKTQSYSKILTGEAHLGPYPMERLQRVDRPTVKIVGPIDRQDARESGFGRARRGDFGLQDFCKRCKKCAAECPA